MAIREIVNGIRFQEIRWSDSETRYIKTYLNKDELFVRHQYKNKKGFINAINKEKNNLNILLESDNIHGDSYIDLSKARKSLGSMEDALSKLLRD